MNCTLIIRVTSDHICQTQGRFYVDCQSITSYGWLKICDVELWLLDELNALVKCGVGKDEKM